MQKFILVIVACAALVSCHPQYQPQNQHQINIINKNIDQILNEQPTQIGSIVQNQPQNQQTNEIVNNNIDAIFGTHPSQTEPIAVQNSCQFGVCVPFYLCKNRSIMTNNNGDGKLDPRFGGGNNNEKHLCPSHLHICCREPTVVSKMVVPPVNVACGIRNSGGIAPRISGGSESQFGEFPWTVAIFKPETKGRQIFIVYACGGSLIDPGVVLTAAHCVRSIEPRNLKIRAGEWDIQSTDEVLPHQDRQVRSYVIHPEYHSDSFVNDVALLFLTESFDIAGNVNTVCLPPKGEVFDGSHCLATGWGKDSFGKAGKYQRILKRIELPIVPAAPCVDKLHNTRLGQHFQLHHSFICAGGERGEDACTGDGGSPLVCPIKNSPGRYAQAGIVAGGVGCGDDIPGLYVNVPLFRDWIDEQMQLHRYSTSAYQL